MATNVITIAPGALLSEAYALLREKRISILVVEQAGRAVGLLTERDAVSIMHDHVDLMHTTVASVMTSPVTTVKQDLSLFDAYSVLTKHHFRHLVVANDDGFLTGVVTLTDMLDGMGMEHFVDLKQVATIMAKKLIRVRPDDSLRLVIDLMYSHRISCVIVAEQWKPVGIITERDIIKYSDQNLQVTDLKVRAVMSSPVRTMSDSSYIPEVNKVMHDERLRHMVVVDHHGRLSGLISQSDLTACMDAGYVAYLKGVIKQREQKISEMRQEHDLSDAKMAGHRLRQSERRFQALIELSHAMPWVVDLTTGLFSYVGKQFEQQLGYPVDTWVSIASWADRIHADDRKEALRHCANLIDSGQDGQFSCRILAANGDQILVRVHISVLSQAGQPIELRGFMFPVGGE